jgi:hypothetical protein
MRYAFRISRALALQLQRATRGGDLLHFTKGRGPAPRHPAPGGRHPDKQTRGAPIRPIG